MKNRIAISIGDYNGIGPELILKSIREYPDDRDTQFLIYAPASVMAYYAQISGYQAEAAIIRDEKLLPDSGHVIIDTFDKDISPQPGNIDAAAGETALRSIEMAVSAVTRHTADAIVTAPISKESIQLAGSPHPGHTEFLSELTNTPDFTMMLVSGKLRVALASSHIPLSEVAQTITKDVLRKKIDVVRKSLIDDFGISDPVIAIFGLNPHAGDGGVLGSEETDIIIPLIKELNMSGYNCRGPFPADGWFGARGYDDCDAVLAMYHDQGLAPFKALSFGTGINFTAGLPIIRTSPDHGTAFAIAGKNIANTDSMLEAIKLAIILGQKRRKTHN